MQVLRAASRDPNVEVAHRAERCLQAIDQGPETRQIVAAAALLAHQKAPGTIDAVLAYLSCIPDDEMVLEGLRTALVAYTKGVGSVDPLLVKALDDKELTFRVLAVQVIAEALPSQRPMVRKKLADQAPQVRYHAARALAKGGDAEGLPTLLQLLAEGPMEYAFEVEDMFCRLLDSGEMPPATLSSDKAARAKVFAAWKKWLDDRQSAKSLKLTHSTKVKRCAA